MSVRGIAWLGMPARDYRSARDFAAKVPDLDLTLEADEFAVFAAENGDAVEVFGPKAIADEHEFVVEPLAGFAVDDVVAARAEMEAHGVRFIGPVHRGKTLAWSHLDGPDDHVFEITDRDA